MNVATSETATRFSDSPSSAAASEPREARRLMGWCAVAFAVTGMACGLQVLLDPLLGGRTAFVSVFSALVFVAWYGGLVPAIVSLATGLLAVDYFILEPRGSFSLGENAIAALLFLFAGSIVIVLTELVRRKQRRIETLAEAAGERQRQLEREALDLQAAEDELRAAKVAAERANEAKDRFLASLSHELRTPLNPALMTLQELERDGDIPDETRKRLRAVRRGVELEARLIDDLLDLTVLRREGLALNRDVIEIHALLRHVVEAYCAGEIEGKGLQVCYGFQAREHHVPGDLARLQQACWNIVKNAVKYTPAGGRIDIGTRNPEPGRIRIEVRDTGIGIDRDDLANVFETFGGNCPAAGQEPGGLRLGLAISKTIVEAHGGTILARSDGRGLGASFAVDLVTCPPAPAARPLPAAAHADAPARTLSILIVEDHRDTATVLARLLRASRHEVCTAYSIEEAKAITAREKFDLVLSDVGLPDGTGYELMHFLKDRYNLTGIALTGFGTEDDVRKSREAGFAEHMVKPIDIARLHEALVRLSAAPDPVPPARPDTPH